MELIVNPPIFAEIACNDVTLILAAVTASAAIFSVVIALAAISLAVIVLAAICFAVIVSVAIHPPSIYVDVLTALFVHFNIIFRKLVILDPFAFVQPSAALAI